MNFLKINFEGGLGNQLFQYAAARSLMKKNDVLLFDTDNYRNDYLNRSFSLLNYNIKGRVITSSIAKKFFIKNTKLNKIVQSLGLFHFIQENGFILHKDLSQGLKFLTAVKGYWQSAFYFDSIRAELLEELVPLEVPVLPQWLHKRNTVAIGVRRTDYLVDTKYGFIGEKYYIAALDQIKVKVENPLFVIFTDDMPWCKNFFKQEDFVFCEEKEWQKDYLKVYLMSKCMHQIVSNSSFYWWGAWLNQNPDKIILRPSHPFHDMRMLYESHYPKEWQIIDHV